MFDSVVPFIAFMLVLCSGAAGLFYGPDAFD